MIHCICVVRSQTSPIPFVLLHYDIIWEAVTVELKPSFPMHKHHEQQSLQEEEQWEGRRWAVIDKRRELKAMSAYHDSNQGMLPEYMRQNNAT